MKNKKIYYNDKEIHLIELINILWKQKIIIFFICVFTTMIGYIYSKIYDPKQNEYKSFIVLKTPEIHFFLPYEEILVSTKQNTYEFLIEKNIDSDS